MHFKYSNCRFFKELILERDKLLEEVQKVASKYGLKAELLPEDIFSVGVQGDFRTYLPAVVLTGTFPGWDVINQISTEITNTLPVNRVTYDISPNTEWNKI